MKNEAEAAQMLLDECPNQFRWSKNNWNCGQKVLQHTIWKISCNRDERQHVQIILVHQKIVPN